MRYKRIKNLNQYTRYCNEYESLVTKGLKKDQDVIELLELLIDDFDKRTINEYGIEENIEPVELLKQLMEEHQINKSQLAKNLNVSRQLITEIVNYKRNISKKMVMKLSEYFKMMPIAFTRDYKLENNNQILAN
jgi:HTH-type transcriptional regulator/antitoxin HigA